MIKYFLITTLLFSSSCTKNEQIDPSLSDSLTEILDQEVKAQRFSGTLAFGTADTLLLEYAAGISDRTWEVATEPDHRFDIASVNKSFFGGLILIAQDDGLLKVTDKLVEHLPGNDFDERITLHHMLTHTSGIPDYDGVPAELQVDGFRGLKRMRFSSEEYVSFISNMELKFDPGTSFYYSNFAYHLLGIILEKLYQKPFNDILQEKICTPLQLQNTFSSSVNEEVYPRVAKAYNKRDGNWMSNTFIDLSLGRRVFSTSQDLFRWGQAISEGDLWSEGSARSMTTNHLSDLNPNLSYGYGLVVHDGGDYGMGDLEIEPHYLIHGGSTEGYKAMLVVETNGEFILTMLCNVGDNMNEIEITKTLIDTILEHNES